MRTPTPSHAPARPLLAVLGVAAFLAFAPAWAKGNPTLREGKILVVRGAESPEPQFTDENGKRWLVVGPLRAELIQVQGHRLRITATEGGVKETMPTLQIATYEILDCGGGRRPHVGTLRETDDALQLEVGRKGTFKVEASDALLRRLKRYVGCKVWVAGDLEESTLKIFKYGWLKCPSPSKPPTQTGKERRP